MAELQTHLNDWTVASLEARVVHYGDLIPCHNAFIYCRTPVSEEKENCTIIGPGVSENPAQHVYIAEPHIYNIGGAQQPPGCVNSQHSHNTAKVVVVHSGHWRFDLGEHGNDAQVELPHSVVGEVQTPILWRVHGHHASGQRVRLIGSSVFTDDADETVIDHAAMAAQLRRGVIDFGGETL